MKLILCALLGILLSTAVVAQDQLTDACSDLLVPPGTSAVIDCGIHADGYTYQWTSQEPHWLSYLSDTEAASPRLHAPENGASPELIYHRTVYDENGVSVNQSTVSVTLQQVWPQATRKVNLNASGPPDLGYQISGVDSFNESTLELQKITYPDELPFLQCASQITVDSGGLAEIPCTGLHQSGGLLKYHLSFDWPPYSKTEILPEGEFVYMIRAPVIEQAASVQLMEVSVDVPDVGQIVTEQVEIHVVNRSPNLQCENITVNAGNQTPIPCSVSLPQVAQFQLLSDLTSPEVYDDWPIITVPDVYQDTSIVMTVRAFGEGGSVTESDFSLNVQPFQTPLDFEIDCTADSNPLPYKEYEGGGPKLLNVQCGIVDGPTKTLVYTLSAEGNTDLDILSIIKRADNGDPTSDGFEIPLPPSVDKDELYAIRFLATTDDQETASYLVEINILEKPDIKVTCESVPPVRTGDPPLSLNCTPSTDLAHLRAPLDFHFDWTSEDDPSRDLLRGDIDGGVPEFIVPKSEDQDEPRATYTYMVTASAPDESDTTDPQLTPTPVTVIVDKYSGKLSLRCTSPIEVFTGDPDFPLPCSVGGDVQGIEYKWDLTEGPTDQLTAGTPPIFSVPASVDDTESSYTYDISVEAPFYDPSDPESVEIIVTQRPQLLIECQDDETVRTGAPPETLSCTASVDPVQDPPLKYVWKWESDNGRPLLSGDLRSAMPVFNVPADQVEPSVNYTFMVTATAPNVTPPVNPETFTVTVEKYPISLECPEELVVMAGMPPERIVCTVSSDEDASLEYVWQWTPTERLSDTSTGSPLFDVPSRQRAYSRDYQYTVTVSAERGISAQTSVLVTVLSSAEDPSEQVEVSVSELDFGVVGPRGQIMLDPATELISGLVYDGAQSHSGRMTILARDSVLVSMEQLPSVVLRHINTGREVMLMPQLANSGSCTTFSANTQASRIIQILMSPEDCHVFRIGGTIALEQAEPGMYSGKVPVALTINELDQLHTIPVVLTVEAERRVVLLGPDGVEFRAASATGTPLDWEQRISIQPQVAALGPQDRSGTFEITNPSVYPMEVEVSMEFGYRETQGRERFSVGVTRQEIVQGDLSTIVAVNPTVVLLSPGETQSIHYGIHEGVQMTQRGYVGLFNFTVTPREFVNQQQSPTSTNARVTFQAPGIYTSGPSALQASVESMTESDIVLLVETDQVPFYGEVVVQDDSGNELGQSQILVYTRSRVRIKLDSEPTDGLTLRFATLIPNQRSPSNIYIPSTH